MTALRSADFPPDSCRVAVPQARPILPVFGWDEAGDGGLAGRHKIRIEVKKAEHELRQLGAGTDGQRPIEHPGHVPGLLRQIPRHAQRDLQIGGKRLQPAIARMEDVLDLYAEAPDPRRPVVCFDESPPQLIGEARQPIPAAPDQFERYDCEYRRNGTVNLFVFLDAHRPWRKVKVTDHRTARDFAHCMRELAECPLSPGRADPGRPR
jgi:hypothetical protein